MAGVVNFAKVVATLPTVQPNTLYLVRSGPGFDLYCTEQTGQVAHKINGSFPVPPEGAQNVWLPIWFNGTPANIAFPTLAPGKTLSADAQGVLVAVDIPRFVVFTSKAAYDAYVPAAGEIVLYQGA